MGQNAYYGGFVQAKGVVGSRDAEDDLLGGHRVALGKGPDLPLLREHFSEEGFHFLHAAQYPRAAGEYLHGYYGIEALFAQYIYGARKIYVCCLAGNNGIWDLELRFRHG